jgi:primosomal protein N'
MNDSKYILQKDCKLNGRDIAITRQQFRCIGNMGSNTPEIMMFILSET